MEVRSINVSKTVGIVCLAIKLIRSVYIDLSLAFICEKGCVKECATRRYASYWKDYMQAIEWRIEGMQKGVI